MSSQDSQENQIPEVRVKPDSTIDVEEWNAPESDRDEEDDFLAVESDSAGNWELEKLHEGMIDGKNEVITLDGGSEEDELDELDGGSAEYELDEELQDGKHEVIELDEDNVKDELDGDDEEDGRLIQSEEGREKAKAHRGGLSRKRTIEQQSHSEAENEGKGKGNKVSRRCPCFWIPFSSLRLTPH